MKRVFLLSLIATLLGTGCVAPPWVPIDEATPRPFTMPTHQMTMNLPMGWMSSYYGPMAGHFFFTVHGAELEQVWIRRWPKTAVVKGTNRSITSEMTLQDISKLSIDSRRLDTGVGSLEVLSNKPVTIGGQSCYRLDYQYRDIIGLPRRTVEYGCPVATWMYRFEFIAPTQYYFDRYLEDFEEMAESIQFTIPGV